MKERLNDWWSNNEPEETLIYRHGLRDQAVFIRDKIMLNMFLGIATDYHKYKDFSEEHSKLYESFHPSVIGTHTSKSVKLPVMEMDMSEKLGLKIIVRYNFYDWCISIESDNEVDCDFLGLIKPSSIRKGYFEGFPKERIYKPYDINNRKNFSVVLADNYELYMFMYIIKRWAIKKFNIFGGME